MGGWILPQWSHSYCVIGPLLCFAHRLAPILLIDLISIANAGCGSVWRRLFRPIKALKHNCKRMADLRKNKEETIQQCFPDFWEAFGEQSVKFCMDKTTFIPGVNELLVSHLNDDFRLSWKISENHFWNDKHQFFLISLKLSVDLVLVDYTHTKIPLTCQDKVRSSESLLLYTGTLLVGVPRRLWVLEKNLSMHLYFCTVTVCTILENPHCPVYLYI